MEQIILIILEGRVRECNGDWEGGGGCPLPGLVEEEGSDLKESDMTGYYRFADLDKLEAEIKEMENEGGGRMAETFDGYCLTIEPFAKKDT